MACFVARDWYQVIGLMAQLFCCTWSWSSQTMYDCSWWCLGMAGQLASYQGQCWESPGHCFWKPSLVRGHLINPEKSLSVYPEGIL